MPGKLAAYVLRFMLMPIKAADSSEIESLRTSLNAIYMDVIKNAQSAQIKFPLEAKARENVCSRDNLLSYIALTIRKRYS